MFCRKIEVKECDVTTDILRVDLLTFAEIKMLLFVNTALYI